MRDHGRARRSSRRWYAFYTLLLAVLVVVTVVRGDWSIALTTLAILVVFGWYTRRAWRRR